MFLNLDGQEELYEMTLAFHLYMFLPNLLLARLHFYFLMQLRPGSPRIEQYKNMCKFYFGLDKSRRVKQIAGLSIYVDVSN